MTDYVTITINSLTLDAIVHGAIILFLIVIFCYLISILLDGIKSKKEERKLNKYKPYYNHWMKLHSEGKYKEASEFYKKYQKQIQEISYY